MGVWGDWEVGVCRRWVDGEMGFDAIGRKRLGRGRV